MKHEVVGDSLKSTKIERTFWKRRNERIDHLQTWTTRVAHSSARSGERKPESSLTLLASSHSGLPFLRGLVSELCPARKAPEHAEVDGRTRPNNNRRYWSKNGQSQFERIRSFSEIWATNSDKSWTFHLNSFNFPDREWRILLIYIKSYETIPNSQVLWLLSK
jgi:hypothetical protein